MIYINSRKGLIDAKKELGIKTWKGLLAKNIRVRMVGRDFEDNGDAQDLRIVLLRNRVPKFSVNLAALFSYATKSKKKIKIKMESNNECKRSSPA